MHWNSDISKNQRVFVIHLCNRLYLLVYNIGHVYCGMSELTFAHNLPCILPWMHKKVSFSKKETNMFWHDILNHLQLWITINFFRIDQWTQILNIDVMLDLEEVWGNLIFEKNNAFMFCPRWTILASFSEKRTIFLKYNICMR